MRWYADAPWRRSRQVLADVLVLVWLVAWVLVGSEMASAAHDAPDRLTASAVMDRAQRIRMPADSLIDPRQNVKAQCCVPARQSRQKARKLVVGLAAKSFGDVAAHRAECVFRLPTQLPIGLPSWPGREPERLGA